ncbi:hypothetical protein JZ751_029157 [Albula glossodonta]|uniref:Neural cell adhesion molecule 2 n=1 Tax=Albula glossodonta TaxID=121402 RepID=A0A8T2PA55_9TELE|nr:hypothetical protein JZ751_029157 [Albula glossodonta]
MERSGRLPALGEVSSLRLSPIHNQDQVVPLEAEGTVAPPSPREMSGQRGEERTEGGKGEFPAHAESSRNTDQTYGCEVIDIKSERRDRTVLQVSISLNKVELSVGESKFFTCTAIGEPISVEWFNPQGERIVSSQHRFQILPSNNLQILRVGKADEGVYRCEARASNKAGIAQQELFLKVFVQPSITTLMNVTAVEGSAAIISCSAEGDPLPDMTWRRTSDGHSFRDGDKSTDGRVEVHDTPVFLSNHTIYYSWEGNTVNLSCEVRAQPPAVLQWKRDHLTVAMATEGPGNVRVHSTEGRSVLEVTPMSDSDFGRYNCTARNNIGTQIQEFILAQADVPSNPYAVRLSSVSQRRATVSFMKPDSHGGVPIVMVHLSGLEPNSSYEVRVAAVNGKGQGEFSQTESFQTLPIREPSPPMVQGQRGVGKAYRLGLAKQDDGGMPILEYIVKYKMEKEERWMTKLVSGLNDFVLLQPLQWNARYEVEITARNVKGLSEPTHFHFTMPQRPDITADSLFSGLGLGAVVGMGVAGFLLLLVGVDVSCFFLRHCGLLMCITRKLRGKKSATCSKSKDLEEGKAAYLNAGSKEPIVEMRTEEERIANPDDGSPVNEPNETTPLTEPEKLPLKEENGKEALQTEAMEIRVQSDGGEPLEDGRA